MEWISKPWPWYVAGPLIGLMVPLLLLVGNKCFGISANFRHLCAACLPAKVPFFHYNWRKETWNLLFAAGVLLGGLIVLLFFQNPEPVIVHPNLTLELQQYGISRYGGLVPEELFNWSSVFTWRGALMMIGGGFLVGFGARYAGGCTSGHAIMGLSTLQWPSLVSTICFMAGGFFFANLVLPLLLNL